MRFDKLLCFYIKFGVCVADKKIVFKTMKNWKSQVKIFKLGQKNAGGARNQALSRNHHCASAVIALHPTTGMPLVAVEFFICFEPYEKGYSLEFAQHARKIIVSLLYQRAMFEYSFMPRDLWQQGYRIYGIPRNGLCFLTCIYLLTNYGYE